MKKFLIMALLVFYSGTLFAHPYEAFNIMLFQYEFDGYGSGSRAKAQRYLDELAKDVGQAIAGGSYGVVGNFDTLGFTMSIKMSYQQVTTADVIVMRNGDTAIYYPIIQSEFFLSEKMTGIARISYSNDSFVAGGGVKYLLYEGYDYIPTISAQSIYNYLLADADDPYKLTTGENRVKFNAWNIKTAVTAYFGDIPYIQPYAFLSYDITGLHAVTSNRAGMSSIISGIGYGIGGQMVLSPLNLSFTLSVYEYRINYNFGIFFNF
ncbi:MAG: hypothetical protein LBD46_03185 [Endomicrobium sp.]|jgi:hypothetical protein|nr:hypothetical protein [Endomicrobium sp.]